MKTKSFEAYLASMPDDSMAKRIYLKILNTPPTDFTEMKRECDDDVRRYFEVSGKKNIYDEAAR